MKQLKEDQVSATFDTVRSIVTEVLGISDQATTIAPSTALLDGIPEFDSMAVVEIVAVLEKRFGVTIDDEEISAETFETFGSLSRLVAAKL